MNLFILGATGGIGRHLIDLALDHGHSVTAFVRAPQKLLPRKGLEAVQGDVYNVDQMTQAMTGHDIVLSAFGPTTLRSTTLRRDFGRTVAQSMRAGGVRRLLIVSSALLFPGGGLLPGFLRATIFRQMLPDTAAMETEIAQGDLDWTIVRPTRLTDGQSKHSYGVEDGSWPREGMTICRADVAHFMIEEAEKPQHVKQIVGVAD
jgi:putative NADH-flavin reductase